MPNLRVTYGKTSGDGNFMASLMKHTVCMPFLGKISVYHCAKLSHQIVNIIDDKNRAAIGAASGTSMAGGGGGGDQVIRERGGNGDGNGVQVGGLRVYRVTIQVQPLTSQQKLCFDTRSLYQNATSVLV